MNSEQLKDDCRHGFRFIAALLKQRETKNDKGQIFPQLTEEELEVVLKELWRIKVQWNFANNLPPPDIKTWLGLEKVEAA